MDSSRYLGRYGGGGGRVVAPTRWVDSATIRSEIFRNGWPPPGRWISPSGEILQDGKLNYLEGAMLLGLYIIIALAFLVYPDDATGDKQSNPENVNIVARSFWAVASSAGLSS
ncbi:hypothetical protein ONS95_000398 [Cadophora gregata]|uniref:uncharacterized protein n=1 Tax=Cadophora gregata TaxID=51156 RepID=UPI0026DD0894|nr:uncharacterized protein ONS95_000398 [Cadophora gregata]KAK0128425.1 hypothetical protein ONS95_000398 [Cadophora gregata]